ncbi:hypothetical protein OSTOST_01185 [Ostertagia ostertagi]
MPSTLARSDSFTKKVMEAMEADGVLVLCGRTGMDAEYAAIERGEPRNLLVNADEHASLRGRFEEELREKFKEMKHWQAELQKALKTNFDLRVSLWHMRCFLEESTYQVACAPSGPRAREEAPP